MLLRQVTHHLAASSPLPQFGLLWSAATWSEEAPPSGGVSYLLCSLIKNREEEDPPWKTTPKNDQFGGWFFRGGPLSRGSWSGNIVNRKPPRGGRVLSNKLLARRHRRARLCLSMFLAVWSAKNLQTPDDGVWSAQRERAQSHRLVLLGTRNVWDNTDVQDSEVRTKTR